MKAIPRVRTIKQCVEALADTSITEKDIRAAILDGTLLCIDAGLKKETIDYFGISKSEIWCKSIIAEYALTVDFAAGW